MTKYCVIGLTFEDTSGYTDAKVPDERILGFKQQMIEHFKTASERGAIPQPENSPSIVEDVGAATEVPLVFFDITDDWKECPRGVGPSYMAGNCGNFLSHLYQLSAQMGGAENGISNEMILRQFMPEEKNIMVFEPPAEEQQILAR